MKSMNTPQLPSSGAMTVVETATYLRISRATVYRLFREGDLRPRKIAGRTLVRREDADALLARA